MPTPLLLVCALSLETYFYRHAEGLVPPNIGFSNGIEVAVSENESLVILLVAKLFFHCSYLVVPLWNSYSLY